MRALARAARGLWPAAGRGQVQLQPARGIVVQVRDGNLERALQVMERKMRSSGIERLIKRRTEHHVKNSEKRVLARKALMARVRSQELGKSLRDILIKKIRSVLAQIGGTVLRLHISVRYICLQQVDNNSPACQESFHVLDHRQGYDKLFVEEFLWPCVADGMMTICKQYGSTLC
uniref:30S ribosomal protein S21 n=1 Tax=Aegilops tauschii TaxID=37682 RepID=M8ASS4_AEGTA